MKESLYDDLLGVIAYDLVVKDSVDMKELEEYVIGWRAGGGERPFISAKPGVFVFSHSGVGKGGTASTLIDAEYRGSNHSFWFNVDGYAFVPFDDGPGWFSNECDYWNSNSDYVPPIGSVRDYHQANPPFPVIYGRVYRENDMWVGKLLSNFNAWAGIQRYRAKDGSVRRGNNIHLKPGVE